MNKVINKIKNNSLLNDSFWAMFGNGLGYTVLLLAGIIIARILGKDLYGEYGLVKTTMFYIASFSTLGLSYTSTKFVAEYMETHKHEVLPIIKASFSISSVFSCIMAGLLLIFADNLATYLENDALVLPFRFLGIIIILRALAMTFTGILGGFHKFKETAIANIFSGFVLLVLCIPLTYLYGLIGSFISLTLSQLVLTIICAYFIMKEIHKLPSQTTQGKTKMLLNFSIPVALQESSYLICHWGGTLLLTKFASLGEVGIYTACAQWASIIIFIPTLLSNVVLSHLSSSINDNRRHKHTVKVMLTVNLVCTFIPFVCVYVLSGFIASFYGESFIGMIPVMRVLVLSTIFTCLVNVLNSELLSSNHNWLLFSFRFTRDILLLALSYILIVKFMKDNGALAFAWANVIVCMLYFIVLYGYYQISTKHAKQC